MENKNSDESLKRSHSKSSNFKLTLLCILLVVSFSALWLGLALLKVENLPPALAYILLAGGGAVTVFGLTLLLLFKR